MTHDILSLEVNDYNFYLFGHYRGIKVPNKGAVGYQMPRIWTGIGSKVNGTQCCSFDLLCCVFLCSWSSLSVWCIRADVGGWAGLPLTCHG